MRGRLAFRAGENKANPGASLSPELQTCSWGTLPTMRCLDSRLRGNDRVVSGASAFAGPACKTKPIFERQGECEVLWKKGVTRIMAGFSAVQNKANQSQFPGAACVAGRGGVS